jgi:hypothetical protein
MSPASSNSTLLGFASRVGGTSVGLGNDPSLTARRNRPQIQVPASEIDLAGSVLQQILDKFEEVEVTSQMFKTKAEKAGSDTSVSTTSALGSRFRTLHVVGKEIVRRRQKGTNFLQKSAWALYEKKKFERLIQDVTEFMDALENVFPDIKPVRDQLCAGEVAEFGKDKETMALLRETTGEDYL